MNKYKMSKADFFHEATMRICGSLEIDAMARECLEYLKEYIPLDGIMMNYFDAKSMSLIILTAVSEIPLIIPEHPIPIPFRDQDQFLIDKDDIKIVNDPEENPIPYTIWSSLGLLDKSSLVLSLWFKGKRLGQIDFFVRGRGMYTEDHGRFIKMLQAPFAVAMANSLQYREIINLKDLLADDNRYLRKKLYKTPNVRVVGANGGLHEVMELVHQVARLDSSVLLLGETGSGKEIIANAIHNESPRRGGPFIAINCGAIPETLIDSELFGHEKGAFTGASKRKLGHFELADGGTLLLDEVGELPSSAQVRLLRVLQEKSILRVGGTKSERVDVRIIAATNQDLEALVTSGRFREDLWFRLNVFPIKIPPLRKRKADIPDLVRHIIILKSGDLNLRTIPEISPEEMDRLLANDWPGNVRELQNIVERALIRSYINTPPKPLRFDAIPSHESRNGKSVSGIQQDKKLSTLDAAMKHHIKLALKETKGRIQGKGGAAEILGINANTLRHRMKKLGIPYGRNLSP